MKKIDKQQRYCPLKWGVPCLEDQCAWWTALPNQEGELRGGECALHALGYVDYTLQALVHQVTQARTAAPVNRKGKKR